MSKSRGPNPTNRLTITVEEAARVLGISRSVAYESARVYESTGGAQGLPVLRFGRRLRWTPCSSHRVDVGEDEPDDAADFDEAVNFLRDHGLIANDCRWCEAHRDH